MYNRRVVAILLIVGALSMLFPWPVYAYLDPGTGSYLFQLLVAGILGLLFIVKVYWSRIQAFLRRLFSRTEEMKEEQDGQDEQDENVQ